MKFTTKLYLIGLVLILLSGCRSPNDSQPINPQQPASNAKPQIKVTSNAFTDGAMIPAKYSCDGENASPHLKWENMPANAKTIAIIADDPDAPGGTWVHWLIFNLPANVKELPDGVAPEGNASAVARQGTNDFKKIGYGGPCPPSGVHRYFFKVYGLDTELSLNAGATKEDLMKAMEGHVVAEGQIVGKYEKKK